MCGTWLMAALAAVALTAQDALGGPVPGPAAQTAQPAKSAQLQQSQELARYTQLQLDAAEKRLNEARDSLIRQLVVDVARDQGIRGAARAVRVEQMLEDEILTAAKAARGHPQELQKLDGYVKRDKRAVQLITSLLGGGGAVDRGPTYNDYLSGGGGGFGLGSKLGLLSSLLGSSSGGGGGGGGASTGGSSDGGGAAGGSDSGSILSLVTPLLGSSSSGGGGGGAGGDGDGSGDGASAGAAGGSDSGSILSLVTPLLGSSSGGSGGGGGGDGDSGASAGGGAGSDLSAILGISNSGGGGGGGGQGNQLNEKLRILTDGVSLLLRVKFLIFRKLFGLLGGAGAAAG